MKKHLSKICENSIFDLVTLTFRVDLGAILLHLCTKFCDPVMNGSTVNGLKPLCVRVLKEIKK